MFYCKVCNALDFCDLAFISNKWRQQDGCWEWRVLCLMDESTAGYLVFPVPILRLKNLTALTFYTLVIR